MFNAHSYAITMEKLLKTSLHSADEIERNPLEFLKGLLDVEYDKSEEQAERINKFDDTYGKYNGVRLGEWEEADVIQMIKDLKEILHA